MKKVSIITASVIAAGIALSSSPVMAAKSETADESTQQKDASDYISGTGVITEIKQDGNSLSIVVENPENSLITIFPITKDVLLVDNGTTNELNKNQLKKGTKVTAYYDKHKPMLMIYPPTITPELLVVHSDKDMGMVKVAKFNQQLVSLDGQLKLNLSNDTILLNKTGEKINKKDLYGKDLVVFYSIATKSIPAQTTPKKIIALDNLDQKKREIQQIIGKDYYMKKEVKMIPLRKVADHLGYHVKWDARTSNTIITISKQNRSYQISIGQKEYGYNRSIKFFEVAPEIKNGKTYVSEDFLEELFKD
ncbi:copper amine oxidase N-terminal domain-containing protein [Heyndrickxia oleronia]|jgi:hypothetical protein|uniref:copper amine oxidase N-terminal domain-containing protein n=1 Tax=Heyndrickxia oleronia TaxID=38875 RepID=UPI00242D27B7|nr:copper amine oxidase N-terminal domain-containing protein [Heyndrickxia oleronia]MCI1591121.1 copper amine oxidase N-terminal domain-containing protein [Heyndrickxia oleronia]MCI1614653.1 copper amine oxidase N-terminal domain-containing protein [Heyndrickxia oleronia]MCI1745528.1 copper amine oxidase N-terminal domain-containing protein [Heyndrickxia oleronia]MCI1762513.1 copper amine oxidase N-terminal domain-containing protein [Heyndrickxia oleronia]